MLPMEQKLYEILEQNDGLADTKSLKMAGISSYYLNKFEENGLIERVKRGMYRLTQHDSLEIVDLSFILKNGVLCLLSAASFHELTTVSPYEHYIAIERNQTKVTLPEYPPVHLLYWSHSVYTLGKTIEIVDDIPIQVYNREKTLCDLVRYRNKLGRDIMLECIMTYMNHPTRNITKLMDYARTLRVQKYLQPYIEVLA